MRINMGLGKSDEKARFTPGNGKSREYGKDHVPTVGNKYNARAALEQAKAREGVEVGE